MLTREQVRSLLRDRVDAAGSVKAFAAAHGVGPKKIHEILGSGREPGLLVPRALGLRRVIMYEPIPQKD